MAQIAKSLQGGIVKGIRYDGCIEQAQLPTRTSPSWPEKNIASSPPQVSSQTLGGRQRQHQPGSALLALLGRVCHQRESTMDQPQIRQPAAMEHRKGTESSPTLLPTRMENKSVGTPVTQISKMVPPVLQPDPVTQQCTLPELETCARAKSFKAGAPSFSPLDHA